MPARLLQELTQLAARTEGLEWFAPRMQDLPLLDAEPRQLPVCTRISKLLPAAALASRPGPSVSAGTLPVVKALIAALPRLKWQQTYTKADGFSRNWLDNYGWVNLISPEGLYHSNEMRLSIGYWGAGQHYTEHSHAPEETYLILAGQARFHSQGRPPRDAIPGDTIHHALHQKHAIDMVPGPLLAAAFWRGEDLLRKSDLGARK
ncbi:dimethylsulfonioproprionate lyase family protein [Leisingera aquimarina]|uniref:dimethylsulfonioproprionate lyase family protein n=1 Tax=Leisingera aquimarina TaxID=476529 RepID=UPI0004242322|nr:dimethylsulfonioproprionate lyase family protein [Leisingera aquimarina]